MTKNTIKKEKIEIEKGNNKSPYIPKNKTIFIDHGEILNTLAIAIKDNLNLLIIGESGTGKTAAIRHMAELTKNGLRRVNLNGGTTADELVGRQMINEKGTYWVDGVLTEAMRNGDWIVLDEINAALPEVLFVLQPVMDDDGYLVLYEKDDKEIVKRHPTFRIFATCNPPEYAGTKEMNIALLSRFAICINTEFPKPAKELEIIKHHLGSVIANSTMAIKLVDMANETRKAKETENSEYAINTRDVLNILRLAQQIDPIEALCLAFANKLDNTSNKALRTMAKLHLPMNKKQANTKRTKIDQINQIKTGNEYIIDADMQNTYFGITEDKTKIAEILQGNKELLEIIKESDKENG
ncbi:MAG: AAA family ATPase, partial [Nanoarchaeota archaeon]